MSDSYTELFFLDEATALAAGHRPCNDCRREDLARFCTAVGRARGEAGGKLKAGVVDALLHVERVAPDGSKRTHAARLADLPDGAMFTTPAEPEAARLRWRDRVLRWAPAGYFSEGAVDPTAEVLVLTPSTTVAALRAGYVPGVHPSAAG